MHLGAILDRLHREVQQPRPFGESLQDLRGILKSRKWLQRALSQFNVQAPLHHAWHVVKNWFKYENSAKQLPRYIMIRIRNRRVKSLSILLWHIILYWSFFIVPRQGTNRGKAYTPTEIWQKVIIVKPPSVIDSRSLTLLNQGINRLLSASHEYITLRWTSGIQGLDEFLCWFRSS